MGHRLALEGKYACHGKPNSRAPTDENGDHIGTSKANTVKKNANIKKLVVGSTQGPITKWHRPDKVSWTEVVAQEQWQDQLHSSVCPLGSMVLAKGHIADPKLLLTPDVFKMYTLHK